MNVWLYQNSLRDGIKTQNLKNKNNSKIKGKRDLRKHMIGIFILSAFKVINWAMAFQTKAVSSIFSID